MLYCPLVDDFAPRSVVFFFVIWDLGLYFLLFWVFLVITEVQAVASNRLLNAMCF